MNPKPQTAPRLGIFAKTFVRPKFEVALDAVRGHGLDCIQFNFACVSRPTLPDRIDPALCDRIREACAARGIAVPAVSGTFNMVHPDAEVRQDGLRRLRVLAGACARLGAPVITLCTGTRDPEDMWRRHPGNDAPDAWADLAASMREALAIAEGEGVTLGVEPEVTNVVDSAAKARRLLDEMGSPCLGIVMDAANLFRAGDLPRMREVMEEAFAALGGDIVIAHAKDIAPGDAEEHVAAGTGALDYDLYLSLMARSGFDGPLILHGLAEGEVGGSVAYLKGKMGDGRG
jgi:sugar phosphate isomerase/epimerase